MSQSSIPEIRDDSPQKAGDRGMSKTQKQVLAINLGFFTLLLAGVFMMPLSGPVVIALLFIVAFSASILYAYLF